MVVAEMAKAGGATVEPVCALPIASDTDNFRFLVGRPDKL
jgi:hypothetical protein